MCGIGRAATRARPATRARQAIRPAIVVLLQGTVAVVSAEPTVLTSTRDMNDKVCEGLYNPWPQKAQNMLLIVVPR